MCLGPCPLNLAHICSNFIKILNVRIFRTGTLPPLLTVNSREGVFPGCKAGGQQGTCPLNSWQNSTPFWPPTHPSSSSGSRVSNGHMSTGGRHISHVWDHVHWIPGEILPHFDPSPLSVAHWDAELVMDTCRQVKDTCHMSGTMSIEFLAKFYPILTPHTPL